MMGERLAFLPKRACIPSDPPPFDYGQDLMIKTSKIRRELGYADVVNECSAMIASASSTDG